METLKKSLGFISIMMLLGCGMFMGACGDDNDDDGSFNMSQLVGSQWKRSYSYFDTDDSSKEDGECLLTFTSSGQAEEYISYHGAGWEWSYENGDEYKSYSGTRTDFYTYQVSGTNIILMGDDEFDDPINIAVSGNKMIASNGLEWTLVKVGSDNNVEEPTSSYTWANMQGVWMLSDIYGAYADEIETYQRQNASSNVYLNNSYEGNFGVSGYQFNSTGGIKDLFVCTKIWHNDNAIILKTIYTSDYKTVYWTDIENDNFSDKLVIRGDEIFQNGNVRFEILNPKMILEKSSDTIYEKVK